MLVIPSWYPAFPGDIRGCFFREQALALAKHGHQVGVIDVQLQSPRAWKSILRGRYGTAAEIDEGVSTLRFLGLDCFPRLPEQHGWLWLRQGMKLFEAYVSRHGRPAIIHAHAMLYGGELARAISEKFDIPFVVTEHGSAYARGHLSQRQLSLAAKVARSADRRLAVSVQLCDQLNAQFDATDGWEEMPNIVGHQFLETELTFPSPDSDSEPFVFLGISFLVENKAVHNLIAAFARVARVKNNVVLRIGGDGVELPRLMKLAAELGVADRVTFLGKLSRDEVLEEMSRSNLFVLASHYETFGVVLVEALGLGKPVIATRCGGPESIVRNEDGMLVPTNDVPALAAAMEAMCIKAKSYDAAAIREACAQRFGEKSVAGRLGTVYSQVVTRRAGEAV